MLKLDFRREQAYCNIHYVDQRRSPDVVRDALEGELQRMAKQSERSEAASEQAGQTDVKSPVASLCFDCSSVRKRVRVMISVLIRSLPTAPPSPLLWTLVIVTVYAITLRW